MTEQTTSQIRLYSLGEAAANIEFGQKELEVIPIEVLPQTDGEVTDAQITVESTGVDKDGNTYATAQKASNSIRAMWLPLDTHRPFPSLIRRGERVMIWRVSDTDKYYWTECGLDDTTRRRDVYTILIPNSGKENENSRTPETAYYIEVNTVDKHITISTNKNDGEKFAYLFQLNPGGGAATICDDVGNYWQLESQAQKIIMKNQSGSEIGIEKNNGWMKTADKIDFTTKKFTVNATDIAFKGQTYTINTGTLTHNGVNVGMTHYHFGNLGRPTSSPF